MHHPLRNMKETISLVLIAFVVSNVAMAEEMAFNRVKVADAKGKQADARLIFSDNNKNVVVRVADRDFVTFPMTRSTSFRTSTPRNTESRRARW